MYTRQTHIDRCVSGFHAKKKMNCKRIIERECFNVILIEGENDLNLMI